LLQQARIERYGLIAAVVGRSGAAASLAWQQVEAQLEIAGVRRGFSVYDDPVKVGLERDGQERIVQPTHLIGIASDHVRVFWRAALDAQCSVESRAQPQLQ